MRSNKTKIANETPPKRGRPRKHDTPEKKHMAIKQSKRKHWNNKYGKSDVMEQIAELKKLISVTIGTGENCLAVRVTKLEKDVNDLKWYCYKNGGANEQSDRKS